MQTVSIPDIYGKQVEVSPKGLMLTHRVWEKFNLEKSLGAKLQLESALVALTDGSEGLIWAYAMPKGMDGEGTRQIYLIRQVADRLLVLNAAVIIGAREEQLRRTLLSAANSYEARDGPIDLERVSAAAVEAAPEIGKDVEKPQEFVFILNKRGGESASPEPAMAAAWCCLTTLARAFRSIGKPLSRSRLMEPGSPTVESVSRWKRCRFRWWKVGGNWGGN